MRILACVATLSVCLLSGCSRGLFKAQGTVASEGGTFNTWAQAPHGCTREPWDGRPIGQTRSIATFLWEDTNSHGYFPADVRRARYSDRPIRLDLGYAPDGSVVGILNTIKVEGTGLDHSNCTTLNVTKHEQPRTYREGESALAGTLTMDCRVKGSHLTANVSFQHCEY